MPMICDLPLADPPVVTWKDWVNNVNREAIAVADEAGNINPAHPERDNFEVRGFAKLKNSKIKLDRSQTSKLFFLETHH